MGDKKGVCERCNSDNVAYSEFAIDSEGGYYSYTCKDCHDTGQGHLDLHFLKLICKMILKKSDEDARDQQISELGKQRDYLLRVCKKMKAWLIETAQWDKCDQLYYNLTSALDKAEGK